MMASLYLKTLYEKRWFMFGWFIGLGFVAFLMSIFYPAMRQDGALDALVAQMPPALQGIIGDIGNLKQFSTYLASQLFDIRMGILGGVMVIILGIGLSVAKEESGQLRTLLSLPISRMSVLLQSYAAMATVLLVALFGMVPGIIIGQYLVDEFLSVDIMIRLVALNWLLLVSLGSIVLGVGLATGKRSITMLISLLVVVGGFILTTFASAVDWLQPYEPLSLMYYYDSVGVVVEGFDWFDITVLGGVWLMMVLGSLLLFRRRDVF